MGRQADVVVIGGGITGTATLAALARLDLGGHHEGEQRRPARGIRRTYGEHEGEDERRGQSAVS